MADFRYQNLACDVLADIVRHKAITVSRFARHHATMGFIQSKRPLPAETLRSAICGWYRRLNRVALALGVAIDASGRTRRCGLTRMRSRTEQERG